MKLKIDYLSFAVIIFVVLFIFRVGWFYMFIPEQATVAHNGQINIATSSILNDEYMYIEGEWLVENNGTQRYVSSSDKPQPYDGLTVASMDVTLDEVISIPLTLHIPRSSYQTKVYIDNVLIKEQSDRHGISYQSYKASFVPKEQRFNVKIVSEGERVEYPFSKRYLAISSEKGVDLRINTNNSLVIFTASIFMMLVISLTVFYIFIESSKLVLYLIVIIAFPTLGELYRILLPYFEWIKLPFFVEEKLFTLLYFLSQFVLLFLFKYLIKRNNAKLPYINSIIVLYALTFIVLALLPVEYIDIASVYLIVFYFVWISYCLNHLLRQVYVSRYELYSLIYIMLSILSGLIWGIVKNNVHYFIPFYTYDYLGLQLGFTGIWLNRYLQNAKTIEKSDRKKEQFLQQVSEQLTMPLSKLELAIDKQRDHLTNQRDKDELLEMTSTVRGMGFILNNWLDYTRLKSESHKAIMQSVDVVSTIRYVCSVIQNSLEVANLNLTLKVESNLSTIIGDAKLLSQVLYNIIYIQLEQMQHNNLQISCSQFNHKLVIQIEDATRLEYNKYKWLAEEDIPIAIQICKAIIDDQGGSLESKDNGFEISLKVQQEQEIVLQGFQEDRASYNYATKTKTYTNESMSILAYSTDLNTNTTLYSVIDSLGDRLTQVHDYNEFVTKYNNNAWDLIILDSTLNDSTSLDILSMIRARFSLIDLPVLVVLVPTQDYFISTYFKNGMNDYVTRPLHAVELKYKIKTLLRTKRLVDQRLELEASLIQNQVEPHFLFNTLNSIASLSKIDVDKMVMLLEKFGQYLSRGFKKRLLKNVIQLEDEIEIVRSYLYIEELRYEPFLKVEWDIDQVHDVFIPPYSIQTIVENSIKHGIRKKRHGGTIKISVKQADGYVMISVSDDGIGMSKEKLESLFKNDIQNGIGVYNTHLRLLKKFGEGLNIESIEGEGTTVTMKLPIKKVGL